MEEKIDAAIRIAQLRIPSLTVHADMQKVTQAVLNLTQAKALYATFGKPTEEMDDELTFLLSRVRSNLGATELQHVTQSVLNLMHAKAQSTTATSEGVSAKRPKATSN